MGYTVELVDLVEELANSAFAFSGAAALLRWQLEEWGNASGERGTR